MVRGGQVELTVLENVQISIFGTLHCYIVHRCICVFPSYGVITECPMLDYDDILCGFVFAANCTRLSQNCFIEFRHRLCFSNIHELFIFRCLCLIFSVVFCMLMNKRMMH